MKTSLTKRILAIFGAILICASMATPALAENKYNAVNGSSIGFKKALVMDAEANVPDVEFEYSIEEGVGIPYAAGSKFQVLKPSDAGVTGTPTIGKATFAPGNAANTIVTSTQTQPVNSQPDGQGQNSNHTIVTLEAGEKAAMKDINVDFSGVSFPEPGVYRYLIKETSAGQQGISYDIQHASADNANGFTLKQRVLDVYVVDNSGTLSVMNYVFHEKVDDIIAGTDYGTSGNPSPVDDKSLGFVNRYTTYDIAFEKEVAGNQASKDKYFKFEVAITNAGKNARLDLNFADADGALNPTANNATVYDVATMKAANTVDDDSTNEGQQIVCDASGAVTKTFYLQHGQKLRINGLAQGANVVITETPEDYKCDQASNKITLSNLAADSLANKFTNTRNGTVPTGVLLSVIPGAVVGAGAVAGLVAMIAKKNKKEEDED